MLRLCITPVVSSTPAIDDSRIGTDLLDIMLVYKLSERERETTAAQSARTKRYRNVTGAQYSVIQYLNSS